MTKLISARKQTLCNLYEIFYIDPNDQPHKSAVVAIWVYFRTFYIFKVYFMSHIYDN
jgi:hypothetical protein